MEEMEAIKNLCKKGTHFAIIGARREGKTCLASAYIDYHRMIDAERKILFYNHPKPKILPDFASSVDDLKQVGNKSLVVVDESSNNFDQYSYAKQSNRFLAQQLKKAGHAGTSFIFIDHTSTFINKNMLRMIDVWILKNTTEFALSDERPFIKKLYARIPRRLAQDEYFIYIDSIGFAKIMKFKKPNWYTDELSTAYEFEGDEPSDFGDMIAKDAKKPKKSESK